VLATGAPAAEGDRTLGGRTVHEVEVKKDFDPDHRWKNDAPGYASYGFFDRFWVRSSDDATKVLGRGQFLCVLRVGGGARPDLRAGTVFTVRRVTVQSEAVSGRATKPAEDLDELVHRNAVQLDLVEKGAREPREAMLKCLGLPEDRAPDVALVNGALGGRLVVKAEPAARR
jgi:hypothetical protein